MKNSLFEMLMSIFGQEGTHPGGEKNLSEIIPRQELLLEFDSSNQSRQVKTAKDTSIRVFVAEEQAKFTKASYQFLMRMLLWGIIASEQLELVINKLLVSDSRYVTLSETKWAIRNILGCELDEMQLAFLDLVLYEKEDEITLH